ncbi:hypothetical protein ACSSS7_008006 [Eimeria intestinalis]
MHTTTKKPAAATPTAAAAAAPAAAAAASVQVFSRESRGLPSDREATPAGPDDELNACGPLLLQQRSTPASATITAAAAAAAGIARQGAAGT